jgi:hypothetical protein
VETANFCATFVDKKIKTLSVAAGGVVARRRRPVVVTGPRVRDRCRRVVEV